MCLCLRGVNFLGHKGADNGKEEEDMREANILLDKNIIFVSEVSKLFVGARIHRGPYDFETPIIHESWHNCCVSSSDYKKGK